MVKKEREFPHRLELEDALLRCLLTQLTYGQTITPSHATPLSRHW